MSRLIVLDTETTGFSPAEGHRIVEIGCLELINLRKGDHRQWYLNPDRDIPEEASKIHGITLAQVANAPRFAEIAADFLAFLGEDRMIIHNAVFDLSFLNAELARIGQPPLAADRAIDTIPMARRKFPNTSVSLDNLCKRLNVDNSQRTFHGALLDTHLLAEVYIGLTGGNQFRLDLTIENAASGDPNHPPQVAAPIRIPARTWPIDPSEESAHVAYLQLLQQQSGNCLWLQSRD